MDHRAEQNIEVSHTCLPQIPMKKKIPQAFCRENQTDANFLVDLQKSDIPAAL